MLCFVHMFKGSGSCEHVIALIHTTQEQSYFSTASSAVFSHPNSEIWGTSQRGSETQLNLALGAMQVCDVSGGVTMPSEGQARQDRPPVPVTVAAVTSVSSSAPSLVAIGGLEGLELSECGGRIVPGMALEAVHREFEAARVHAKDFASRGKQILASEVRTYI